jgi:isocitrate dehydrogenase
MVIFRETTEDIYAGIDFEAGSEIALKTLDFIKTNFPKEFKKIRFGAEQPATVADEAASDDAPKSPRKRAAQKPAPAADDEPGERQVAAVAGEPGV